MKTSHFAIPLALVVGIGIGMVAVQGLHAQSKAPTYFVGEIDMSNPEGYRRDLAPLARASMKKHGARVVAAGKPTPINGEVLHSRVVILAFDDLDKLKAWFHSEGMKKARKAGAKHYKARSYALKGFSR